MDKEQWHSATYEMYMRNILFPVTPGKMSVKINGANKTVTLINEGEVNLIKTPGLTEITIDELLLPTRQEYPFAKYLLDKFRRPQYYLKKLEKWKKKKKPIQFLLLRCTPDYKRLLWDTYFDCTIEDYEIIEDADKYGMDVCVKLHLKEYRHWGTKKLVKKKKKSKGTLVPSNGKKKDASAGKKETATVKKTRKAKEKATSYIVKSGDCLINIARKQLNDGSKWTKIYDLNKPVIEAEAKKRGRKSSSNGHWIYPGTVLKLPS